MFERLDAKVKIMTQQLQARDKKIQSLENTVNILQLKIDDQEQNSRSESPRISGIPETASENTDQLVVTFCNETLKCDPLLQDSDLARSHRSGDIEKTNRVILAKFSTYKKFVIVLSGQGQSLKTSTKTMTTQFMQTKI